MCDYAEIAISKWLRKEKDKTRSGYTREEIREAFGYLREDCNITWEVFLNTLCKYDAKLVNGLRDYENTDMAIEWIMSRLYGD